MNIDYMKGILDTEFKFPNPLTGELYSFEYKELFEKTTQLAAYQDRFKVIKAIKQNQVTIITAKTGVGKTVWIPKFVLHALNYNKKVVVTNPKQILTRSNAEYMAKTLDVTLGKEVGYKFRKSPKEMYNEDETKLLFSTDGFLAELILGGDTYLSKFHGVILDEVHERKVNTDLLLYLLKRVLEGRPEFKLILISATLDAKIFEDYFPKNKYNVGFVDLEVSTTFPIEVHYSDHSINDYLKEGSDLIIKIINESEEGDIIFFVTSYRETKDVCKLLETKLPKSICIEMYAAMDAEKEILAKDPDLYRTLPGNPTRKIIISTNVSESSLTVKGLKYVIDSGRELFFYYDPILKATVRKNQWTTKAQAKQRRGRIGRTAPGICYHLFTEEEFNKFRDYPMPEIQKTDITLNLLKIMGMQNETVKDLKELLNNFIEPPNKKLVSSSLKILYQLGALNTSKLEGRMTKSGKKMLELGISDVYMAKSMLKGYKYGCGKELAIIISLLELLKYDIQNIFYNIKGNINLVKKYLSEYGDHITLLRVYNDYYMKKTELKQKENYQKELEKWCHENYLNYKILSEVKSNAKKILKSTRRLSSKRPEKTSNLERCILDALFRGLYINLGFQKENKYEISYRENIQADINKGSILTTKKAKELVMFNKLFVSHKIEMNIVSNIPKEIYEKYHVYLHH